MKNWRTGTSIFCILLATTIIAFHQFSESRLIATELLHDGLWRDTLTIDEQRIAWFREMQYANPIFAFDGTDPEKLEKSLLFFNSINQQFLAYYPSLLQARLAQSLYPVDFLRELPSYQRSRNLFINSATRENAASYEHSLESLIDKYISGVNALKKSVEKFSTADPRIIFPLGWSFTPSEFNARLEAIAVGAKSQKKRAETRYACSLHYTIGCESAVRAYENALHAVPIGSPLLEPLPAPFNSLIQEILTLKKVPIHTRKILSFNSTCAGGRTTGISWRQDVADENGTSLRYTDTTNPYFRIIAKTPANSYFKELGRRGAQIEFQITGNFYLCPDSGIDASTINQMYSVQAFMLHATATSELVFIKNELDTHLREFERAGVWSDDSVYIFLKSALTILSQPESANSVSGDTRENLKKWVAIVREGSWHLDENIFAAGVMNMWPIYASKSSEQTPVLPLVTSRSFASFLYQMGNPSVQPEQISFGETQERIPMPDLITANELVSKGTTISHILKMIQSSLSIERGLEHERAPQLMQPHPTNQH